MVADPWAWPPEIQEGSIIAEHGAGLFEAWANLAFQDPPEDILGRILWTAGVLGQMLVSTATFPAAIASFLLEEAVQSYGMGAYMLSTAGDYENLETYLENFGTFISVLETSVKTMATINPIAGGAVLIYMAAAKAQHAAFTKANNRNILKQAEKDEELRKKLELQQNYAKLHLQSSPSGASIFMNGEDLQLTTPETFKQLDAGTYEFTLKKWSALREVEETLSFNVTLEAGYKKEIFARIPKIIEGIEEGIEQINLGQLHLLSTPTGAEIYLDNVNTNTLTPETFKQLEPKQYNIKLRAFSRSLGLWDEYEFNVNIEADTKTELKVNIPGRAYDKILEGLIVEEEETPQLPLFIKAEVTGDHAIDGDTFATTTGERIRVLAIDAPELGNPWSIESKENLGIEIEDKKIMLRIQSHKALDAYGRTLAICSNYKGDIGVFQLSSGLARTAFWEDDLYDTQKYLAAEQVAKDRAIGIWS